MMHLPVHLLSTLALHLLAIKNVLAQHYHLSLREVAVLGFLAVWGKVAFTQLHRQSGIPKSALTSLIDRLCARSLVERRQDSRDRRRWWVFLTPEGERFVQRLQGEEAALLRPYLQGLSAEEERALHQALEALTQRLTQAQPDRRRHVRGGPLGEHI